MRRLAALLIGLAGLAVAGCATPPASPLVVKVLAINDFHGNLKTPASGLRIRDPNDTSKVVTVAAGGAEHLATAVAQAKAKNANHVFVAAGDLVGATPLLSALFRDEPTIEALSAMGLEASAVGNHEFDRGAAELLRLQRGGCAAEGCKGPVPFAGARFQYLAASTIDTRTGQPILPPVFVKRFEGVPVAFIGLTLKDTPRIVVPSGVAGLRFDDEAATVNALVPGLRREGIEAIVLLIHEGGVPGGAGADYNECPGISGPIVGIVNRVDRAVDVVVSGHTHRAYNCRIDGRLVTSADRYGTVLSEIDLTIDRGTRDITAARATNLIVRPETFVKNPAMTSLIAAYETLAAPLAQRVVGRLAGPLSIEVNAAGESVAGQVVADAQLAATREQGAQLALMNPGGLRAPVGKPGGGPVTYEELFALQPFGNNLVTVTLNGAQLLRALEEQWLDQPRPRILQVSRGFVYRWNSRAPVGQRIVAGSAMLDGTPIDPARTYRVTINGFLADGGDSFKVFAAATERRTGLMDIDALERHVATAPGLPGAPDVRILRSD